MDSSDGEDPLTRPGKRLQFVNWKITTIFGWEKYGKIYYFDWAMASNIFKFAN